MENQIIYNAIKTPDGTILKSTHRHDYQIYIDKNGEEYMVDGGRSYLRRNVNTVPFEELTVYSNDDIEKQREVFTWGTYGKVGEDALSFILLKDMSTDHILNCVMDAEKPISGKTIETDWVYCIFKKELEYRRLK